MSASKSASTKPPLSVGKARTETAVHKKKPASSLPTVKHKGIHRSSSFSEQDESHHSRTGSSLGSRSSNSASKLCKDNEVGNSNSAIVNSMEREINVSILVVLECRFLQLALQPRLQHR